MELEHALFVAIVTLLGGIHLSGIMTEVGPLAGRLVIYIDHAEMFIHHEIEMFEEVTVVEEAGMFIEETFGHVDILANDVVNIATQVIEVI